MGGAPDGAPSGTGASPACGPPRTVLGALASLGGDPRRWVREWNWKAALTSSISRGLLFFCVNLTAGWDAARAAMLTEVCVRAVTAGFYGSLTARFRHVQPAWAATATAGVLLPLVSHGVELMVHWRRGTDALAASIAASVLWTVLSTAFNLHLMRHGVMIVGDGSPSLRDDLRALPRLARRFVSSTPHLRPTRPQAAAPTP